MEGHYDSQRGAPLILFGIPDDEAEKIRQGMREVEQRIDLAVRVAAGDLVDRELADALFAGVGAGMASGLGMHIVRGLAHPSSSVLHEGLVLLVAHQSHGVISGRIRQLELG